MSQAFTTAATYITRTALGGIPSRTAWTIGAWFKLPASAPGASAYLFDVGSNGYGTEFGMLRYNIGTGTFRFGHSNNGQNLASNPAFNQWVYFYLRNDATNLHCGWKRIADSVFTTEFQTEYGSGSIGEVRAGGSAFGDSLIMSLYRLSFWGEAVTDANLLLAAATDLGYTTNLNTHLPLNNGVGSPWNDTSGNSRNWTNSGTFSDDTDPSLGGGGGGGVPKSNRIALLGVG